MYLVKKDKKCRYIACKLFRHHDMSFVGNYEKNFVILSSDLFSTKNTEATLYRCAGNSLKSSYNDKCVYTPTEKIALYQNLMNM
jgi:hypothetical protein